MNHTRSIAASAGGLVLSGALVLAQGSASSLTMPFSDPARPGTVRVSLFNGGITVRAASRRDVIVTSDAVREMRNEFTGKAAGLRRLSQPAGLTITEENNVMTIATGRLLGGDDVEVQVPARVNLHLSTVNGNDIRVEGIEGEVEVTAVNGDISLTDVAGAVVAHATNGDVLVRLRRVTQDKPMAFTSFNGDVDVTLPQAVKANVRLRSDRGEIYTDFDVQIQSRPPVATTISPAKPSEAPGGTTLPSPPQPPLPPAPPFVFAPGVDLRELQRLAQEQARTAREFARQATERRRGNRVELDAALLGTINGGGPEFELRTFNGDIYLRKGQ